MICTCSMAGTIACRTCPTNQWVDEGRAPSKVFFAYGVDAVEVVRCRDCIHGEKAIGVAEGVIDCKRLKMVTRADWFCAEGKRDEQDLP